MRNTLKISLVALVAIGGVIRNSARKTMRFDPKLNFSSHENHGFTNERVGTFYDPTIPVGSGVAVPRSGKMVKESQLQ